MYSGKRKKVGPLHVRPKSHCTCTLGKGKKSVHCTCDHSAPGGDHCLICRKYTLLGVGPERVAMLGSPAGSGCPVGSFSPVAVCNIFCSRTVPPSIFSRSASEFYIYYTVLLDSM